MAHSSSNPSGDRIPAVTHRRCVGHDALRHRFFLAPRFNAGMRVAIGAAISSKAP
jgi:hypothetical protein